ncbi:MarR family winged helix-turn-helix transcriptional regulator [Heyndrickxia ginsengihumi]|uniref:TrmB family transcriptional regulator n=1 Tax=Heyndrickxia ginsengihumi TaxID=363870 RepID=A0A0A6VEP3_9BACI|nr:MarR family transcriptional regulator [Heyndrickxia ginsengihumi]KHD86046.1 TrmB family transcriptional regulator [Heyndrickxia ginsengihumi]MBE6184242.1 MarR family transcriptional regulator [Bacillus sp. (in: firmicutes)]NEY20382.1 winged helix DNA-binding protein [Heyndrickxia ginsengihumi]
MGRLENNNSVDLELIFRNVYRKIREEMQLLLREYVTTNEYMVLKLLSEVPMRSSDLSRALQVSASHITSVTDSLVEKGLIERNRSSKDRRVVDLLLTDEGKALVKQLNKIKRDSMKQHLEIFTEEERNVLIKLFRKFEAHLNQQ